MTATERLDIAHHFGRLEDPRDARFVTHRLGDLLTIALSATLAGAKSFEDIAALGRAKQAWLRSLGLALPDGIPSPDTFRDLFRHLAPRSSRTASPPGSTPPVPGWGSPTSRSTARPCAAAVAWGERACTWLAPGPGPTP